MNGRMPWLRHFALFVVFVTALFKPAAAGAFVSAPDANAQARVGAFELVAATLVGPASAATCGLHEGIGAAYDENASGYRFAARALPAARYVGKGFAQGQLDKHFAKHAAEWGAGNITKTGYLKRAQSLLGRDTGGDILGHVRANGDVLRYNAATNEFAAGAADGTIRTLFRPSDGMAYWLKQVTP
jgi:hypothetical protein